MNRFRDKAFQKLFQELGKIFEKYASLWRGRDVPWWYSERSVVGFLSAAIWRGGGVALEEFATKKQRSRRRVYNGRCDLYFSIRERRSFQHFCAEAKHLLVKIRSVDNTEKTKVEAQLVAAIKCAKQLKGSENKLAILFVAPYWDRNIKNVRKAIKVWTASISSIACSHQEFYFPARCGLSDPWGQFPGMAVLVQEVD